MISRRTTLLLPLLFASGTTVAATPLERPFALLDTNGRMVSDKDFRGRWLLVFFGYTRCPDICPLTLQSIAAVLDQLGPAAGRVQPVFVTIDPAHDTGDTLRAYLASSDKRIIGLTGSAEQIARTAATFGAQYLTAPGSDADDSIAHSALVYVIGPEGGMVTQFSNVTDADGMARTLAALVE